MPEPSINPTPARGRPSVSLRPIEPADLPELCAFQQDAESCELAAVKPRSTDNYMEHWRIIFTDSSVVPRAILADGELVGSINKFRRDGVDFVGYWIGREHWGRGIASRALALLLEEVPTRPLRAQVAARHDIVPKGENEDQHIRRVRPGDHLDKLRPDTIEQLNEIFAPFLDHYGYGR